MKTTEKIIAIAVLFAASVLFGYFAVRPALRRVRKHSNKRKWKDYDDYGWS
jgi:Kef-type K+ transport system membrane component KefB